jgi:hypothetical protein
MYVYGFQHYICVYIYQARELTPPHTHTREGFPRDVTPLSYCFVFFSLSYNRREVQVKATMKTAPTLREARKAAEKRNSPETRASDGRQAVARISLSTCVYIFRVYIVCVSLYLCACAPH